MRWDMIVGSLSRGSVNRQLAGRLAELAPAEVAIEEIEIAGLPLFDYELEDDFPLAAREVKARVEASELLVFVTPEYNRSIPAALKNVLDWGSRPWGSNSWAGRRAAVIGTGLNGAGTAVAQSQLRGILGYLGVTVVGATEVCLPWRDDLLDDPAVTERLRSFLAELDEHARAGALGEPVLQGLRP
ncbi:NADPH-dependent FMN reductase [Luteimicrobium sp. NPDC057192]|uniref:NADPH-dependent FMN reductase n=1 Tax=Luteimicrobium sp. NPDC057192 TaxID=3346042 RepID=UPI003633C43F